MNIHTFDTSPDFELGSQTPPPHSRQATYKIHNANPNNGLIIYIPGFGGDLGEYTDKFLLKIAEQHPNYSVMCVEYFCMRSRPSVGATVRFETSDKLKLGNSFLSLNTNQIIEEINKITSEKIDNNFNFTASLVPPNNEYQNFGLLAALDIINASKHACNMYNLNINDIILIGSSYGGYVANMATKIAPCTFRAVFDNSSWASPNLAYVVGRELSRPEFSMRISTNTTLSLFVVSPWTLVDGLPHSFSEGRMGIRSFDINDICEMFKYGGDQTFYYFIHAENDYIANTKSKLDMAKCMISNGMSLSMDIMEKSDIDGKFIKSMDHGMGVSMVEFFNVGLSKLLSVPLSFKSSPPSSSRYKYSDGMEYIFNLESLPITGEVKYQ